MKKEKKHLIYFCLDAINQERNWSYYDSDVSFYVIQELLDIS